MLTDLDVELIRMNAQLERVKTSERQAEALEALREVTDKLVLAMLKLREESPK